MTPLERRALHILFSTECLIASIEARKERTDKTQGKLDAYNEMVRRLKFCFDGLDLVFWRADWVEATNYGTSTAAREWWIQHDGP